jgi:hypothetical protein
MLCQHAKRTELQQPFLAAVPVKCESIMSIRVLCITPLSTGQHGAAILLGQHLYCSCQPDMMIVAVTATVMGGYLMVLS